MAYVAMFNRLLVKLDKQTEKVSSGGIIMADYVEKPADRGTVISVGEGYVNDRDQIVHTRIQIGQRVVFRPGMGYEVCEDNGDKFVFLVESDVLGLEISD